MPGTLGAILCRTRYLDDVVRRLLAQGLEQLVILGAGFDTRAYRIAALDRIQVLELDLPGSVRLKRIRLEKVLGAVPGHVTLVGIDFDWQALGAVLQDAGFQGGSKTLFLWEGVTQYLTAEAVKGTLEFVSAVGGAVAFTYVPQGIIDGSARPDWFESLLSFARRAGSPFPLWPGSQGNRVLPGGPGIDADRGHWGCRVPNTIPCSPWSQAECL